MATIKDILQEFCGRVNIPVPTSFIGVNQPAQRQYLSLFKLIGDMMRNMPYQWPQLKRPYYFYSVANQATYQLAGDFYRLLDSTQWDVTNQWPMRGPISDYNMALRDFAVVSLQVRKAFQIIGPTQYLYSTAPYSKRSASSIKISPTPVDNDDEMFMGYISCNWIWPRDWESGVVYPAGSIRSGDGFVYYTELGGTAGGTRPYWSSGEQSDGGVLWSVYREPYLCAPSNAALNDDDFCLFDDDLMIEGMRWAYFRAKKMDYMQERKDWEEAVKNAYARFESPLRINMAEVFDGWSEWPITPQGNWSV